MTAPIRQKAPTAIVEAWANATDNATAAENLRRMMAADPDLYREIVAPFEAQAAMSAVSVHKRQVRSRIFNRPSAPDDRVHQLARTNAVTLLDVRLPQGLRLGDATKEDLTRAIGEYEAQAGYLQKRAAFLRAVAGKMKGNKPVSAVWSAADLERIRDAE